MFSLYESYERESVLYTYIPGMVFGLALCRFLFTRAALAAIGSLRGSKFTPFRYLEEHKEKEFVHSAYYALCLICSVSLGEFATYSATFRSDYSDCFRGWPDKIQEPWLIKFYFTFCLSFYLYSVIMVVLFENRKKDFVAMFVHHCITLVTLFLAGYIECYRMPIVIMLLFDQCDVVLEVAKLFNKCKEDLLATGTFAFFVLVWMRNRLYYYPRYIIPMCMNAEVVSGHEIPYHKVHIGIILMLCVLNIYWSYFIIRKLIVTLGKNGMASGDPREDK